MAFPAHILSRLDMKRQLDRRPITHEQGSIGSGETVVPFFFDRRTRFLYLQWRLSGLLSSATIRWNELLITLTLKMNALGPETW